MRISKTSFDSEIKTTDSYSDDARAEEGGYRDGGGGSRGIWLVFTIQPYNHKGAGIDSLEVL
jgi:hypothetical protein